ncbi:unnamed protein product [Rangifer tarandus platyrhynchus]|uniref:Uncharacterized protein n=1 Tax=Rangifer tarandus platyrhynchus TaxID=3082113 RepID=A0AC59ZFG8_RANTA
MMAEVCQVVVHIEGVEDSREQGGEEEPSGEVGPFLSSSLAASLAATARSVHPGEITGRGSSAGSQQLPPSYSLQIHCASGLASPADSCHPSKAINSGSGDGSQEARPKLYPGSCVSLPAPPPPRRSLPPSGLQSQGWTPAMTDL